MSIFMRMFAVAAVVAASLTLSAPRADAAASNVFGASNPHPNNALNLSGGVTLSPVDSGWYNEIGEHFAGIDNYVAGICCGSEDVRYNNFFVFNISDLTDPVTSASLTLFTWGVIGGPHTYTLFDVSTGVETLMQTASGAAGIAIHNDLGSGTAFGSRGYTVADAVTTQTINLNDDFLAALNAAIAGDARLFAIGGTLFAPIEEVPEPVGLALLGVALIGLGASRRRRASV